jgi:8-oxo-dGTP pyrophosphatase MutT (NUDIX family)
MMRFDRDDIGAALGRASAASTDFDLNPDHRPLDRILKPAAVLVAVSLAGPRPALILTKRASHLKHHPGQIALPGGKLDAQDASATAAALREAWEEIALPPDAVEVCGQLATHETVTAYQITPILGLVRDAFDPIPAPDEVAEVFTVPMDRVLDLDHYRIETRIWGGQRRRFYVLPYGPYYIWGATARILRGLAQRMQP